VTLTAVFSAPFLGGGELFNLEYLRQVQAEGVEIDAVIPDHGALEEALRLLTRSIRIVTVPGALQAISRFDERLPAARRVPAGLGAGGYALRLLRALRATEGPIVAFGLRSQLAVGLLQPVLRRPVSWVVHEVVPPGAFAALWARASRRADVIWAYSHSAADQPLLQQTPVQVMPVRLNLDAMATVPDPQAPPRTLGLIGDLFPLKNHLALVRLVERLRERGHDVQALLVGRPHTGEKESIDAFAAAVQAASDDPGTPVRLVSVTPDRIPAVMAEIDVLCHLSSIPETFGRVCAEAMAAGRPVIAYGHGAVAEIVLDGRTGVHSAPNDEGELVSAFERIAADPERFRELSRGAREHAVSQYGAGQRGTTIAEALAEFARR
jgi:glycosyltransferase involved in cell wall biosynthesis